MNPIIPIALASYCGGVVATMALGTILVGRGALDLLIVPGWVAYFLGILVALAVAWRVNS